MENSPTALPLIGVGKSSTVYRYIVPMAPEAPMVAMMIVNTFAELPFGTNAAAKQANPQDTKLKKR